MQETLTSSVQPRIKVVITGVGAVTASGLSALALWEGVKSGRVAIRQVTRDLPMKTYRTQLGGEVPAFASLDDDSHCVAEPTIAFAIKAAREALAQSSLSFSQVPRERCGAIIGTCMAGLVSSCAWYKETQAGELSDPTQLVLSSPQGIAEAVSSAIGFQGPVASITTACAAGANAIGYAADLIWANKADVMLAGGTDSFSEIAFAGFHCLESLSPNPAAPYSWDREGLSLGEGSGMLVLMREDIAQQYKQTILGEVLGYGLSADGYHPTAPHPEGIGASKAMSAALSNAGLPPDRVGYINGHGTGTVKNDVAETKAIKKALEDAADTVAVSSSKSIIGHSLGAAGAVEGIITVKALREQFVPPTANYALPDPECDLDYVPNVGRPLQMDVALSNSFAFGGHNACLALGRADIHEQRNRLDTLKEERIVITGISALTPAGCDVNSAWDAFLAGRRCAQLQQGAWIGRMQNVDSALYLSKKERRRMDQLGIFSVVASHLALRDAGIEVQEANQHRLGLLYGTGIGPMESMENFYQPLLSEGTPAANPAIFPNLVYNAAAGLIAMHTGVVGPTSTVSAGHAAGAAALCYGYHLLSTAQADAMICLAADSLTESVIHGYKQLGLLATEASKTRKNGGFILAEAAVGLVLERLSSAQRRGAHIYGEMVGYGIASDAQGAGNNDPQGRGIERAMHNALTDAHLMEYADHRNAETHLPSSASCLPTVWANMAGYRGIDIAERVAIRRIYRQLSSAHVEDGISVPQIISPKQVLGEPVGAGGLLNAALALKAWQQSESNVGRQQLRWTDIALINSSSLGGTHWSFVLKRYVTQEKAL